MAVLPGSPDAAAVMRACASVMAGPWIWGRSDCCTAAADVFVLLWGVDPMAGFRGRFASATEAARLLSRFGGLPGLARRAVVRAGLVPGVGAAGEIGLTGAAASGCGPAAVIGLGNGQWVGKTLEGWCVVTAAEEVWACRR